MHSKPELKRRAHHFRRNPTPSERTLWARLRRKQLGFKFRRQHVLPPYIVDFYCHAKKVVVEVDGDSHNSERAQRADGVRDESLEDRHGIKRIIRVTDVQVSQELDAIVEGIEEVLQSL